MGRYTWTDDRDAMLRQMNDKCIPAGRIASKLGIAVTTVTRRMKALGITPAHPNGVNAREVNETDNDRVVLNEPQHLSDFKKARRGFVVPPEKEGGYIDLLKQGIPIAEARRRIGS